MYRKIFFSLFLIIWIIPGVNTLAATIEKGTMTINSYSIYGSKGIDFLFDGITTKQNTPYGGILMSKESSGNYIDFTITEKSDIYQISSYYRDSQGESISSLKIYRMIEETGEFQFYKNTDFYYKDYEKKITLVEDLPAGRYKFTADYNYYTANEWFVNSNTELDKTPPGNVTDLKATPTETEIQFSYTLPNDPDFSHLEIYRDSELIQQDYTDSSFHDEGLTKGKEYEYKFVSVDYEGNKSDGEVKKAQTIVPLKDVTQLGAEAEYNRVNLSWKLPNSTYFQHVNIYRDEVEEKPGFIENLFAVASVSAAEEPTKIFETNGTYFNDLTVSPETTYEYKLTSQSTTGEETGGVTIQATTEEEPTPEIVGGGFTETEDGDFLYKWDEPTTGQVKVSVAGKDYKIVKAENGQLLIPKEDMEYTVFGDPDVSLSPISPYGKEGDSYNPPNPISILKTPFTIGDVLSSSMGILAIFGPFVLLGVSFLLFPRVKNAIVEAIKKRKGRGYA